MTKFLKVIDNETIEISDYRCSASLYSENPPTLQNVKDQIENRKDWCVFKEVINPFELYAENQQLKKQKDDVVEYIKNYDVFEEFSFPLMKKWEENQVKSSIDYQFKESIKKDLLRMLGEIDE